MNIQRLTRKEREERILDLYYNKRKTYREIAKLERMCPRDIGVIVNKESKNIESKQSLSKAAQAYKLFEEGKSPMEVAVTLDLREPEVTQLYKERWNLKQIGELNRIYLETGGNLAPFLLLNRLAKAAGYSAEHVVWLLGVTNKALPELEGRHYNLKSEVDSLETKKQNLVRIIQDYSSQITSLGKTFDNYCLCCEQEASKLDNLQQKRSRLETLLTHFENDNEEYGKATKIVEEKVYTFLSSRKRLLEFAALSVIESIRKNPEKYTSLIQQNPFSTMDYTSPDFNPYYMYGQQQPIRSKIYFTEDYVAMILEDADKLLENLVKVLGDEVISGYTVSTSPSPSLPAFSTSD